MAKLLLHLQDHLSSDYRTLAALACTEKAAATLARPLLTPLKPRWFLSFYGRDNSDYDDYIGFYVKYVPDTPDEYPATEPHCGLKRCVQLELLPEGFAVRNDGPHEYQDSAANAAVRKLEYSGVEKPDDYGRVHLQGFSEGQRFSYGALKAYVDSIMYHGCLFKREGPFKVSKLAAAHLERVVLEVKNKGKADQDVCVPVRMRRLTLSSFTVLVGDDDGTLSDDDLHAHDAAAAKFVNAVVETSETFVTLFRNML